jgi:hypothetical protein
MRAVRHVPIVGGQHPPGDRVDAVTDAVHAHAVAPGVAGVDRRVAVVHPLAMSVQDLERARAPVDPLAEPDHDLVRCLGQRGVGGGIARGWDGVAEHGTRPDDGPEKAEGDAPSHPAIRSPSPSL